MTKSRNPALAFILTLICPADGFLYVGKPIEAVIWQIVPQLMIIPFIFLGKFFLGLILFIVLYIGIYIYIIRRACVIAKTESNYMLQWYNRWYVYLAVLLILSFATSSTSGWIRRTQLEAFKIPSESMSPTLIPGDHIIASKNSQEQIIRDDIVVFTLPEDPSVNSIKRVVAIGGDTIELQGKNLIINGKQVVEPYTQYISDGKYNFGRVQVPEGKYVLLGDNRDKSKDSRFWEDPFLSRDKISGKVLYVYWNNHLNFQHIGKVIH